MNPKANPFGYSKYSDLSLTPGIIDEEDMKDDLYIRHVFKAQFPNFERKYRLLQAFVRDREALDKRYNEGQGSFE